MVEGRISAGVLVGDGSDVGGGLDHGHAVGRRQGDRLDRRALPARRQLRPRHLAGRRLRRRGRLYVTAGTKVSPRPDRRVSSRPRALGRDNVLFRRNSVSGAIEAVPWKGEGIDLNAALHANDHDAPRRGPWCRVRSPPWRWWPARAAGAALRQAPRGASLARPAGCTARGRLGARRADLEQSRERRRDQPRSRCSAACRPGRPASRPRRTRSPRSSTSSTATVTRSGCSSSGRRRAGARGAGPDPVTATNAFYDALDQVDGYESMRITEAAQGGAALGLPGAYADHEQRRPGIASALTGNSQGGVLVHGGRRPRRGLPALDEAGLTRRAAGVRADLAARSASSRWVGAPGRGGDGPHGLGALRRPRHRRLRPPGRDDNKRRGWAIAGYLVAQADRLGIYTVIFDDRTWKVGDRSRTGGRTTGPADRRAPPASWSTATTSTSTSLATVPGIESSTSTRGAAPVGACSSAVLHLSEGWGTVGRSTPAT